MKPSLIDMLACPFCGAQPILFKQKNPVGSSRRPQWVAGCSCYCVQMVRRSKKEAIADWNKRV